jgi:type II secretory pathway component GspD/PulD (secretin)
MKKANIAILCILCTLLGAQTIKSMDFVDKPIQDILIALALQSKRSIVPDETVTGSATFYFPEYDLKQALLAFLPTYKLYMREESGVIYVSRIDVRQEKAGLSMHAEDVDPSLILKALSATARRTVSFDALPKSTVTVHSDGLTLKRAVEIVMARYPDYQVTGDDELIQVRRIEATAVGKATARTGQLLKRDADGNYSIDTQQARFFDLLDELFRAEKREYSLLMKSDILLERLRWERKPFEKILDLILEQAGADYGIREGIIYVYEQSRKDPARKLKESQTIPLNWIPAQDAISLLSQDLSNSALYRIDKSTNSIILSGNAEDLSMLKDYILLLDRPLEGRELIRYRLNFIKAKELSAIIPPRLLPIAPILTPNEYVFLAVLSKDQQKEFEVFLSKTDRKEPAIAVPLKYIKAEDLMKALPPSVAKEDLQDAGNQTMVYFTGSPERLERFKKELEAIDRPKPLLRYDILAVQYTRTPQDLSAGITLGGSKTSSADGLDMAGSVALPSPRDAWSLVGTFKDLLNLKFDVLSLLGINYGLELNAKLKASQTQVLSDTSITALSGQEAKLQATSTVRYIQPETNTTTGQTTNTGPTQSFSSGLIFSVSGWLSGDGMVTMTVSASLSETQPESGDKNFKYPTTERIVSTQLRTRAGEPVIISGLLQKDKRSGTTRIPLLGQIPGIGRFFSTAVNDSEEIKELVIYIVPRLVEDDRSRAGSLRRMEAVYQAYCAPRVNEKK